MKNLLSKVIQLKLSTISFQRIQKLNQHYLRKKLKNYCRKNKLKENKMKIPIADNLNIFNTHINLKLLNMRKIKLASKFQNRIFETHDHQDNEFNNTISVQFREKKREATNQKDFIYMNIQDCSNPAKLSAEKIRNKASQGTWKSSGFSKDSMNQRNKSRQLAFSTSMPSILKRSVKDRTQSNPITIQSTINDVRLNSISSRPNFPSFRINKRHLVESAISSRFVTNINKSQKKLKSKTKRIPKSIENSQLLHKWI